MIEGLPAERMAGLNNFVKAFAFRFTKPNSLLRAQIRTHDLKQRMPAAFDFRNQPLAYDPAQRICQAGPDLVLLLGFEHTQDTIDGLAGIDRVQCAQDQVTGFSRAESDLYRIPIAHFTNQDHFRCLA
ncbi:hypothetical protein SDC9_196565 [bioreactor metagenome]|uniref:Uncharacterized protein n=1 Tax=bioreactor metagenome TaxID=1076179 RepID=A0A645IDN5_9ZZZZ